MRRVWEEEHDELPSKEVPAKSFFERRTAHVNEREFFAEALSGVASQKGDAITDDSTQAEFLKVKACVRFRRTRVQSAMPTRRSFPQTRRLVAR